MVCCGEGDQTDIVASAGTNFDRYRYVAASHATPIGSDGLTFSANAAYLRTETRGIRIRGDAQLAGVALSYPLIRGYRRNLTVSASLDGLNSDNAAFGTLIARERTRAARFAAGYSDATPRRTITLGATFSQGLDILGARVMAPFSETGFTKGNARATIDQAIGKRVVARLRASGQYTRDRLPAAERFAVGGQEFGRGFETAVITADRGYAGLAELAWRPLNKGPLAPSELYTFVDGAHVDIRARGPLLPGGDYGLASAGAGVRLAYTSKAAVSLEAAHGIDRPYPGYDQDWQISVGWRLSLAR